MAVGDHRPCDALNRAAADADQLAVLSIPLLFFVVPPYTIRNIIALFFIDTEAGTDVNWSNATRNSGRA
jgi:hypothetical protein